MIGNMQTDNERKIVNYQILSNYISDVIMWELKYDIIRVLGLKRGCKVNCVK